MVHWPDVNVPFQETMEVLVSARDSGKVRHVGVSNFSPLQLRACKQLAPLVTNQVGYNLFDRRWEIHAFETCRELDISVMAYGSLAHGLLSGTWDRATRLDATDWRSRGMAFRQPLLTEENLPQNLDVVDRLMEVAARVGVSLPQLALAWVLRDEVVATALVGCRRPFEVDDNLGALDLSIDDEVLGELDGIMQGAAGQVQELPA
jgi:aryl-alcohol dehydrogenase-like predicted oxidoreductase